METGADEVDVETCEVETVELTEVTDPVVLTFVDVPEVEATEDVESDAVATELRMYNSNRFPAPQYSSASPGQTKLQSVVAAATDPAPRLLPQ